MKLIDEAVIEVIAGDGGNGCLAFRREKYVPYGGPSGGDGGRGGSVVFVASERNHTLLDFKYKRKYAAKRGEHGQGSDKYGKSADDLILTVPVGTTIYDAASGELLFDLVADGQSCVVAKGGRGGFGNIHFVSSTNQAPQEHEDGEPGESRIIRLSLRLLADVGLLGLPNAGKSTLLSVVSAAKPRIANYPFTTLSPNLGVVAVDLDRAFVMADIPGLIEGASEGRGLGHQFLKHLERCRLLLHLVEFPLPDSDADPVRDVETLEQELQLFDERLAGLPRVIVMTKTDLGATPEELEHWRAAFAPREFLAISAVAAAGVRDLLDVAWHHLNPPAD